MSENAIVKHDSMGAIETRQSNETATSAVAAQAKAAIEARYVIAMRCPRDIDQVRSDLMRECDRPSFAGVARYRKPIGDGIEGLSIRFVEAALASMGNFDSSATTVYDDDDKRIIEVVVVDLEKNAAHRKQITVAKHVERRNPRSGQTPISRRIGSNGQTVYIVQATDDELLNKEAALVSKALRTCGLRLIPGWLQDECDERIQATMRNAAAKDPDAERRKMSDAFAAVGVTPKDLAEYLGHDLAKTSPAQLVELRAVYMAIKDGQTTWSETIGHAKDGDATPVGKGKQAVKEALAK